MVKPPIGGNRTGRKLGQKVKKGKLKASSRRWLERHINDPYVQRAKLEGYRARAAFKLLEIDEREVELDAEGRCSVERIALVPRRDLRILEGELAALVAADNGNLKLDTGTLGFRDISGQDKEHSYYVNAGGTFGWGGAASTIGWVDRTKGIRASGWSQIMTMGDQPFVDGFSKSVYASLAN